MDGADLRTAKAIKNFAAQVVELAFVRDRIDRGFGDQRVFALQNKEADGVMAARAARRCCSGWPGTAHRRRPLVPRSSASIHRHEGQPGVVARLIKPVRRWLTRLEFRQMWQFAVAALLAVTALFGGLDSVDTKVTPFKPGEEFNDGEFTLTVDRATLVNELRAGATVLDRADPGHRFLAVVAELRNDGTVPGKLTGELDLRGQPDQEFVGVVRIADGSRIQTLGPGLTEHLAFVWKLPDSALQAGQTVTLRVWKMQFRELAVTYGKAWIDSLTHYGETVVPVTGQP